MNRVAFVTLLALLALSSPAVARSRALTMSDGRAAITVAEDELVADGLISGWRFGGCSRDSQRAVSCWTSETDPVFLGELFDASRTHYRARRLPSGRVEVWY